VSEHWLTIGARVAREHERVTRLDIRPSVGDVVGDVRALQFADATFDGIECHHVLEHLLPWDARGAVRELWRVLRPGGVLEASVPDLTLCAQTLLAGNLAILSNIYSPDFASEQQHRWGYTVSTFMALLREAGFVGVITIPVTEPHEMRMRAYRDVEGAHRGQG
jgi:predicted SAM-dependent methyltransferase